MKYLFRKISNHLKNYCRLNITHYEMINIVVALNLWGVEWSGKKVLIKTDNMAVVSICTTGYTRDNQLAAYARNIWLLTAIYDIELVVAHVAGRDNNIADLLSRWSNSDFNKSALEKWVQQPIWFKINDSHFEIKQHI